MGRRTKRQRAAAALDRNAVGHFQQEVVFIEENKEDDSQDGSAEVADDKESIIMENEDSDDEDNSIIYSADDIVIVKNSFNGQFLRSSGCNTNVRGWWTCRVTYYRGVKRKKELKEAGRDNGWNLFRCWRSDWDCIANEIENEADSSNSCKTVNIFSPTNIQEKIESLREMCAINCRNIKFINKMDLKGWFLIAAFAIAKYLKLLMYFFIVACIHVD